MIRSCIRQAVRVFAGAALITFAVTTQAANITISASNCASYTVGAPDQNGNVTLTCIPASGTGPLIGCSIQGSTAGTIGSNDTLTAVCSGGAPATNWTWSGGSCAGLTTQACPANESSAITQTYSVVIHNGAGADANASLPVTWSSTPPAKPTGCSITPSTTALPAGGGNVNLTAQCTGGGAVANWNWSGATYTTTSGNTASATISANTTFTVGAQNAGGTTNASVMVNVGVGGPISCDPPSGKTLVIDMPWANPTRMYTSGAGGFGPNDIVVVRFTTGSTANPSNNLPAFTAVEFQSGTSNRIAALSATPCDFSGTGQAGSTVQGSSVLLPFAVGNNNAGYYAKLKQNTTYYMNIKNGSSPSCASTGNCDMSIDLSNKSAQP